MCLVLLGYNAHPKYRLVVAANRDEFYDRPTAVAAFWEDAPSLYAGRDLVHGGTWLGVTREGRFAALTNYREPLVQTKEPQSRGLLVSTFLMSRHSPEGYLDRLHRSDGHYSGYNLLVGDLRGLYCYSNRSGETVRIEGGIHGLSNHLLDTPWPKVARGKELLARQLQEDEIVPENLFELLADRRQAGDVELPSTGIGLERERYLSSIFIAGPHYGTRASTVLLVDVEGNAAFYERSFDSGGSHTTRALKLTFPAP